MKHYAKLFALLLLLSVLVILAQIAVVAGPHRQDEPPVGDAYEGPPVGPEPSGETIKLAPLVISEEMRAANATVVSDDFNSCALDTDLWTFINPVFDGTQTTVGTFTDDAWLDISVPAGSGHNIWTEGNFAPRVVQSVSDTDFEVEVKFESGLSGSYQMQGILVEQDASNFLRFEFYSDESTVPPTILFAASLAPAVDPPPPLGPTVHYRQSIGAEGVAPLYMRVRRQGNLWTLYYSFNGNDWTTATAFAKALTVTKVGTYASNCCWTQAPAHTGHIDYFFNTASPIVPEDGDRNTLTVNVVGGGSVTKNPDKGMNSYDCNEVVTLTANPAGGQQFLGWSGDLLGTQNPATITMNGDTEITATFSGESYTLTVLEPLPPGGGTTSPAQGTYSYGVGQVVPLVATPNSGWAFSAWLDGAGNPSPDVADNQAASTTIAMSGSKQVRARFVQGLYEVTVTTVGNGTVTNTPGNPYGPGEVATLMPVPDPGYCFSRWTGPNAGELTKKPDGTYSLTMNANKSVTANFAVCVYMPLVMAN